MESAKFLESTLSKVIPEESIRSEQAKERDGASHPSPTTGLVGCGGAFGGWAVELPRQSVGHVDASLFD